MTANNTNITTHRYDVKSFLFVRFGVICVIRVSIIRVIRIIIIRTIRV
jgi:hypothetical protein